MALDIQPLSPGRQAAALVLLLALFGGSLAFAGLLVRQRQGVVPTYRITVIAPKGMTTPVRAYEGIDGAVMTGEGLVMGVPRRFGVFSYASDVQANEQGLLLEARRLMVEVTGGVSEFTKMYAQEATIGAAGRMPAVQLAAETGRGNEVQFVVVRLTAVPTGGRVVAICYSGAGALTDPDREIFDEFCANGVVIRRVTPKTK